MKLRIGLIVFVLLWSANAAASTIVKVAGQVVDAKAKPVAGARIAEWWFAEQAGPLEPIHDTRSGADGQFSLEIELYARDTVVTAFDKSGMLGGLATVSVKAPQKPLRIELLPLAEVRVRYTSEQAGQSLGQMYLSMFRSPGTVRVGANRSDVPKFAVKLPPGRYTLYGEAGDRQIRDVRDVTLEPGKSVDLGEIKLRLSPIARLVGKPAPAWHLTDARGVPKTVQPSDFKGKWVVLEFWGYWCGPCVERGLPGWFAFAEDHAADRDKFVILTVCDPRATDFKMLDEKLKPIVHRTWRGRLFPFPILLDTSGQMVKDHGIPGWPTAILIDPEGRVAEIPRKPMVLESNSCEDYLASKLAPLPTPKRIARALDRDLALYVDEDQTLAELMEFYGKIGRIHIGLDRDELKAAVVDEQLRVPLKLGGRLTLHAWLNLTLEPFGLTYVADGDGLRVVRATHDNLALSQPSSRQEAENALVAETLNKKVTFQFHGESLKQMIAVLETKTDETFVLDPAARRSGAINPSTTITGSAVNEPLSSALTRLLAPLGMTFTIRDEVVVLTTAR